LKKHLVIVGPADKTEELVKWLRIQGLDFFSQTGVRLSWIVRDLERLPRNAVLRVYSTTDNVTPADVGPNILLLKLT
jgi:hypothetical protein